MLLPALEAEFKGTDGWDLERQIPLGDDWLATWNWARKIERLFGIDHQEAVRVAHAEYFSAQPMPEGAP